jgi:hypothetical protein
MTKITKQEVNAIKNAVEKFRGDIIFSNPIAFLVRNMNGEEFEGERLSIRDRVEVAKFLASRIMPVVGAEDMGMGKVGVTPPPLTIILNNPAGEKVRGVDTMMLVGESKAEGDENDKDDS